MAKILTVDDSASIREMVIYTLSEEGHELVEAENGQMGLERAKAEQFDLVISDVNMPIMDGITFISNLRQEDNYRFTPILMLTTESGQEKKMAAKKAGATGWVVKPFDQQKLISLVNKVLR